MEVDSTFPGSLLAVTAWKLDQPLLQKSAFNYCQCLLSIDLLRSLKCMNILHNINSSHKKKTLISVALMTELFCALLDN